MRVIININQKSQFYKKDPREATVGLITNVGQKLVNGMVDGSNYDPSGGEFICGWRVLDYEDKQGNKIVRYTE